MNDELHPIQREMLRIETEFEQDAPAPGPPIDACIAKMIGFEGDVDAELDPMLMAEARRAVVLLHGHYSEWMPATHPLALASVAFMQGVTFCRAAFNLREVGHG